MGRGYGLGLAPGLGLGLGSTSSIWWRHKGSGAQQPEQSQPNAVSSSQLNDEAKSAHVPAMHVSAHSAGGGDGDAIRGERGAGGDDSEQQPEQSQPNAVSSSQLNDEAKSAHWWRRHWRRHADGGGHVDG